MRKLALLAYRRGLISSRTIAQACQPKGQFIAISGDSQASRHNKRLTRLNHRGCAKVNTQRDLLCRVHKIEKLAKMDLGQVQSRRGHSKASTAQ